MRDYRPVILVVWALLGGPGAVVQARAQETGVPAPSPTPAPAKKTTADRGERRLFQRFAEDAAIAPGGWVELQYRYENGAGGSAHTLGPLVAFKIVNDVEAGLRFGWTDVNLDGGGGGSGLSDLDLYAKYRFSGGRSRAALGAVVKLPTADETEGLGTGEKDFEAFAAWRADLDAVSIVANAGYRFNGSPAPPLPPVDDTWFVGGGFLLPASPRLTLVIETTWESARLQGSDDDARLILGFEERTKKMRNGYRAAVMIPLTDGAPDYSVIGGLFLTY